MARYTASIEEFQVEKLEKFKTVTSWSSNANPTYRIDEKRLIRKIDYAILPILFCAYFLQFLDKVVYNVSQLQEQTLED